MKLFKHFFLNSVFVCLFLTSNSYAQSLARTAFKSFPNSQARLIVQDESIQPNLTSYIGLHLIMDEHWHSYWKNPGDSGAQAQLSFSSDSESLKFGDILWPNPMRIDTPPLTSFAYENEVLLMVPLIYSGEVQKSPITIKLDAQWLLCKEECIPAFGQFILKVNTAKKVKQNSYGDIQNVFSRFKKDQPQAIEKDNLTVKDLGESAELSIALSPDLINASYSYDFFISSPDFVSNKKPSFNLNDTGITLSFKKIQDRPIKIIEGTLKIQGEKTVFLSLSEPEALIQNSVKQSQTEKSPSPETQTSSVWLMALFAFLGGIILNLMPCVFPIISLKLLSFTKYNDSNSTQFIRKDAGLFILGCISCFQIIAFGIILLKQFGLSLGWGFQLQSPWFIFIVSVIFLMLSLSFIDLIHFEIPALSYLDQKSSSLKHMKSFFSGFLAVLVASPCSAPFMGISVGYAFTQGAFYTLIIFLFLSLGFTLPYLYVFFFPKHIPKLPKSGSWLMTFKHILFFPMLATVLWLSWLYGQLQSVDKMFWLLFTLLFLTGGIYILKAKKTLSKLSFYLSLFLFLSVGLFSLNKALPTQNLKAASSLETKVKSNGLWNTFNEDDLEQHLALGQSVFIDFTADWCVSCKVNEAMTFSNSRVLDFIASKNIIMMKADWTQYDPKITAFLKRYNRASVPFYIYYSPNKNPVILPEILTPNIFIDRLSE